MQSLNERTGSKKSEDLSDSQTEEEQQVIMSDYSLKNLLEDINVVGVEGGLTSVSKRIRDKIDGDRKEIDAETTTEKRRRELTGDMSLEKRVEFYNELISGQNPHFKSVFVLPGHEETLDGYIIFSSKDESDINESKEPTDLFVAEAFYELGDTKKGAYGCATYIFPRDKISLFLFGKDGKSGRSCLRELASNPQERIKIIEHYPGQESVRRYHEAIAEPEKAIREKLERTRSYTSEENPKNESEIVMNKEQENEEYNRIFMEELNESVLNGILTKEEIEEYLKNNRGRVINNFDFHHLYYKKAYRETGGTNKEMIIESLRNAGEIEDLTPEQIEIEAKKVFFYIIATKKISSLYGRGYDIASDIIDEAVSEYQEYLSEFLEEKGETENIVIEDVQEDLEGDLVEEVELPENEGEEEVQEEIETGQPISATARNIDALLQEREKLRLQDEKLRALSEEYDKEIAKMNEEIAMLQEEEEEIDNVVDEERQAALEAYQRRLDEIDAKAEKDRERLAQKISELTQKIEETQGLRNVTKEGTNEARRMVEEKNAQLRETLEL